MSNTRNVGKVFNLTGGGGGNGPLKLASLAVTTPPNKTTYKSGESFDPTGMVVTADYGYGITSDVTGYIVTPSVLTDGIEAVTVTYTEGRITKTANTPVTVEKVLVSIEVSTPPLKTAYHYLENFDPAGMVVSATFSDGSKSDVTDYSYSSAAFSVLGQQIIELSYIYDGMTKSASLTVTVGPVELPVPTQKDMVSYDGTTKFPSWNGYDSAKMTTDGEMNGLDAGDYTVTFTLVYGYAFPDGTNTAAVKWAISRAVIAAVPTQADIPAADGAPKNPSWNGYDPAKMTIGGDRFGVDAGEYTATFTPTANYQWWDGSIETKNAPWKIVSILVPIPVQRDVPAYDGLPKTPEWSDFDTEHCAVQVASAVDAGEYEATFTLLAGMWSDGTTDPKTIKWKINRATIAAVPVQSGMPVYDGNPKTPVWDTNYDSVKMTVSVEAAVNAGTGYTASFTPTPNYQWWDGSTEAKNVTWSIDRATIAAIPSQSVALTYNGNEQSVTLGNYSSAQLTLGGTVKGTDAGTYSATVTPTANYKWSDGATTAKTISWIIGKAIIATVPSQTGTLAYNGSEQSLTLSNYNSAQLTLGGTIKATNAGTYNATVTPTANYKWSDGTSAARNVSWSIGRATIATVPNQSGTLTYNGSEGSPTLNNYDSAQLTLGGTIKATNAGTYSATVTPTANYKWSDGTTTAKTISWSIAKAAGSLSISPTSLSLTASAKSKTISVTRTGNGTITATSSNTAVATVSVSGTTVTVTGVGNGSATITVKVAAGTNHNAPSNKTCSVSVSIALPLNSYSWSEIKSIISSGQAANYWSVGDRKAVTLKGTLFDNYLDFYNETYYCYIIGINHNSAIEGANKVHFQFGYDALSGGENIAFGAGDYDYGLQIYMNDGNSNNQGGWSQSHMRNTVCARFKDCLPSDLKAVLKTVDKYTDNTGGGSDIASYVTKTTDTIFLLSEFEVFGKRTYANSAEQNYQKQYDYYKAGNSAQKRASIDAYDINWWLRSAWSGRSTGFCEVDYDGSVYAQTYYAAFAPAFCVG